MLIRHDGGHPLPPWTILNKMAAWWQLKHVAIALGFTVFRRDGWLSPCTWAGRDPSTGAGLIGSAGLPLGTWGTYDLPKMPPASRFVCLNLANLVASSAIASAVLGLARRTSVLRSSSRQL
ncbi:hypothetical protein ACOMHN_029977 [Nucella lapillus]